MYPQFTTESCYLRLTGGVCAVRIASLRVLEDHVQMCVGVCGGGGGACALHRVFGVYADVAHWQTLSTDLHY